MRQGIREMHSPTPAYAHYVLYLKCGHRLEVSANEVRAKEVYAAPSMLFWECPLCDIAADREQKKREMIARLEQSAYLPEYRGKEANPQLTHVRTEGDQTKTLCGLDVNTGARLQTYSYRHLVVGYTLDKDLVATKREGRYFTDIDRADAIRDGIESVPEPLCSVCVAGFLACETVKHPIRNVDALVGKWPEVADDTE